MTMSMTMSTDMSIKEKKRTGAVIVAAGLSSRMKAFKPMLPLGEATVIRTLISTLRQVGVDPVVVVTGRNAGELSEHICDLAETVNNADYAVTDMFHSACLGLEAIKDRCHRLFFMPGDVPLISSYSLLEMMEHSDEMSVDILTPSYNGNTGHPVLIDGKIIPQLLAYQGQRGLKGAIASCVGSKDILPLPDPGLVMDADEPADYDRLLEYAVNRSKKPCARLRVSIAAEEDILDEALAQLLELTEKYGSLTRACRHAGISYSCGWKKLRSAEEALGFLLLKSTRGGKSGGGSKLTPRGSKLLRSYKKYRAALQRYAAKQFDKYFDQ